VPGGSAATEKKKPPGLKLGDGNGRGLVDDFAVDSPYEPSGKYPSTKTIRK